MQEFVSSAKRPFPSELELVDFKEKTEDTRLQINKSVSDLTDGKYLFKQSFKSWKGDEIFDFLELGIVLAGMWVEFAKGILASWAKY